VDCSSGFGIIFAEGYMNSAASSERNLGSTYAAASMQDVDEDDFIRAQAEDDELFERAAQMLRGEGLPVISKEKAKVEDM